MIVKQNEGFVKKYFHEMGDFSRYNFSDFTNEFVSLVNTTFVFFFLDVVLQSR